MPLCLIEQDKWCRKKNWYISIRLLAEFIVWWHSSTYVVEGDTANVPHFMSLMKGQSHWFSHHRTDQLISLSRVVPFFYRISVLSGVDKQKDLWTKCIKEGKWAENVYDRCHVPLLRKKSNGYQSRRLEVLLFNLETLWFRQRSTYKKYFPIRW